jgi:uncharacterized protein (TIGR00369 family)
MGNGDGWRPFGARAGFLAGVGPLLWRRDADGLAMGFRVADRHCNPVGFCHGGMLMTLADVVMGFGLGDRLGQSRFVPTIALAGAFRAPAPLGTLVWGRAEVLRQGRRIGFAQCLLRTQADAIVLRASGTFQLDRPADAAFSAAALFPGA